MKSLKKLLLISVLSFTFLANSTNANENWQWKKNNIGWWYENIQREYITSSWKLINSKWYYFDNNGYMVSNSWIGNYYLGSDGAMLTNTTTPDGYKVDKNGLWINEKNNGIWLKNEIGWWYKFSNNSYPKNSWEYLNYKWYYFDGNGYMVTGWRYINSKWYFMNSSGDMAFSTWIGDYYLGNNGDMLTNTTTPDGYKVDENGKIIDEGYDNNDNFSKSKKIDNISYDIFKEVFKLKKDNKNFIISPLSIQILLDEISNNISDKKDLDFLTNYDSINLQNIYFRNTKIGTLFLINNGIISKESVKKQNENIKVVDFPNTASSEKYLLQSKIFNKVIDYDKLSGDNIMVLLNAIHFDVKWANKFNKNDTSLKDFKTESGDIVKVPTMSKTYKIASVLSDEEKDIIKIDNDSSWIYFIKPKKDIKLASEKLNSFVEDFDENYKLAKVNFSMPKVDFSNNLNILNIFNSLKLNNLVNGFTMDKLLPNNLVITQAKQIANLSIDENGVVADAITQMDLKSTSAMFDETVTLNLDSPYYIIIKDVEMSKHVPLTIFTGYIANPLEK